MKLSYGEKTHGAYLRKIKINLRVCLFGENYFLGIYFPDFHSFDSPKIINQRKTLSGQEIHV